ncbi:MAG: enterochelin esterase-like enzyme [Thalassolituus oleivorans]|jgi:enterochelin esterase-like enzyme
MKAACSLCLVLVCFGTDANAQGVLSENQRIHSESLGYTLQYRVYTPPGFDAQAKPPVLYLTDGQWYIDQGGFPAVLDDLILQGTISPVVAVFIDNRNPDQLSENRRNSQFFCNPKYESFVSDELVPVVDAAYHTAATRETRAILGLSFGGLNSACFALHESETFANIGMQSPATRPVGSLHSDFQDLETLPIRVFLSSGDHEDNEAQTRRLRDILETRVEELEYTEVPFAHTWDNWKPLLDDAAVFFFGLD